jgi:hypothetical protein
LTFEEQGAGEIAVEVHQVVRDVDGAPLSDGRARHVYTFREGVVARMDIQEAKG